MIIDLPEKNVDAQKVSEHINAYTAGYITETAYELTFLRDTLNSGAFYPDSMLVENAISKCWNGRVQSPRHVISCCFNLAGLQDKKGAKEEKGKWLDCLKSITEKSVMAYADPIEERTATMCALKTIELLSQDPAHFSANLFQYSKEIDKTSKARFGVLINT